MFATAHLTIRLAGEMQLAAILPRTQQSRQIINAAWRKMQTVWAMRYWLILCPSPLE